MTTSDKLREIAAKWKLTQADLEIWKAERRIVQTPIPEFLSDLTALISEHYVSKEEAGYPPEFVEWLIKDQEIFFGELNEEYILNDNIHVGGRKLQTIDELYNYWKENEQ